MQTRDSLLIYKEIIQSEIKAAKDVAIQLIGDNISKFTFQFPSASSVRQFYDQTDNDDWTNGFWTGTLWLAYEETGEACYKDAALIQVDSFLERIKRKIVVDHHDMGFLYSPSCVAAYKLTQNQTAKKAALLAADNLLGRFQEKGQFFQAWGHLGDEENYRLIIDCLLNMPLLFWATEVTGDSNYADKAASHIETAMQYVIRGDNSTYHTYYFDPETGDPLRGMTHQGYRDGSAWARGQAWGIYGAALSYGRLKKQEYIDVFIKLVDYFISHLPKDLIPYWDFDFNEGSVEPRDSSAAVIAICGMLEMAKYLEKSQAEYYTRIAKQLMKAIVEKCSVINSKESNGLLLHGTYAKASPYNPCTDVGVEECNIWGDYYYMEALIRLSRDWNSYW